MKKQCFVYSVFLTLPFFIFSQNKDFQTTKLTAKECKQPVIIAVVDAGIDISTIPKEKLWINPKEKRDNIDNDDNGCVDDINGICFRAFGDKDNILFEPLLIDSTKLKGIIAKLSDTTLKKLERKSLESGKNSEEMMLKIKALQKGLPEDHGTFVAGIVGEGNPSARIMAIRSLAMPQRDMRTGKPKIPRYYPEEKFDPTESVESRMRRMAPFMAKSNAMLFVNILKETGNYIKVHNVKVVNLSGINIPPKSEIEMTLSIQRIENPKKDSLINEILDEWRSAINSCFGGAKNTLFVISGLEPKNDPYYKERFPNGYNFSNVIVVGSSDTAKDQKSTIKEDSLMKYFKSRIDSTDTKTTEFMASLYKKFEDAKKNKNVNNLIDVYVDNTTDIESLGVGGVRKKYSSSTLAAPQVVNLAAKILALHPEFTPEQVKDLIIKNSITNSNGQRNIQPQKTLDVVRRM